MAFSEAWFTHACFGVNLNPGLNKSHVFLRQNRLLHKALFHTKTMFLLGSAVCGLQDSSFHGSQRNTPKAVKYELDKETQLVQVIYILD